MVGFLEKMDRLIKGALFLSFLTMIVAVFLQVIARTFMEQPPVWTEEASRVSLLFIMSLGVGASILTGDLVNVDLALMVMPKPVRRFCELVSAALVSVFGFILIPGGWEFAVSGALQTSPILEIRMHYVYASMLIFTVLLGVFGLIKFIRTLVGASSPCFTPRAPHEV